MAEVQSINLAATASGYAVLLEEVVLPNGVWTRLCPADPQRWYLQLATTFPDSGAVIFSPKPYPLSGGFGGFPASVFALKYRDCPALVTGEWFGFGGMGGSVQVVTERFNR